MEKNVGNSSMKSKSITVNKIGSFFRKDRMGILAMIILLILFLSIAHSRFATGRNILNILLQMSVVSFMSLGLTFVIAVGGIDLSLAGVVTISGVMGAAVMEKTGSAFLGIALMILIGLFSGTLSGFLIAKFKMVPFIVTLSIWVVTTGLAAWYTKGITIPVLESVSQIGRRDFFIIPIPVIILICFSLILFFFLERTTYGRLVYATGANEKTALSSGIRTSLITFSTYVISGFCAGLAAFTLVARIGVAASGMGGDLLILDAITAVIIGGASLKGGRGTILGTLGGVLIISLVGNGLNLFGVSYFLTIIIKGVVIFLAVMIDAWRSE